MAALTGVTPGLVLKPGRGVTGARDDGRRQLTRSSGPQRKALVPSKTGDVAEVVDCSDWPRWAERAAGMERPGRHW